MTPTTDTKITIPGAFADFLEGTGAGQGTDTGAGGRLGEIYAAGIRKASGRGFTLTLVFTLPSDADAWDYLRELADSLTQPGMEASAAERRAARTVQARMVELEPQTAAVEPEEPKRQAPITHVIRVGAEERLRVAGGRPVADQAFDVLVEENPAAIITMSTVKGNQVRYYDGPLVAGKKGVEEPRTEATRAVIRGLLKSTGMHREAWESLPSSSMEDFRDAGAAYLGNHSDSLSTKEIRSANWAQVFDEFHGTAEESTAPSMEAEHPSGAMVGYGRVSTVDQNEGLQVTALKAAGCGKIFVDKASGKSTSNRPELADCLKYLRAGDTLCVWKLDRIARSIGDLISIVDGLKTRGINFKVLTGALSGIDTRTPDGRLFLVILGGMAEFERSLISERTRAGLAEAKAAGRVGGRRKAVDDDKLAALKERVNVKGESVTVAAKALGLKRATAYRALAAAADSTTDRLVLEMGAAVEEFYDSSNKASAAARRERASK